MDKASINYILNSDTENLWVQPTPTDTTQVTPIPACDVSHSGKSKRGAHSPTDDDQSNLPPPKHRRQSKNPQMTLAEWVQDVKGDAEKIVRGLFNNLQLVSNKEDSGNPICIFPRKKHTKGPVRSEASACLSCIIKRMTHPDHRCHDRMWKDAFVSNICYDCSTVGFSKTCMNVYDFESISELPSSIITLYCRLARTRRLPKGLLVIYRYCRGLKQCSKSFKNGARNMPIYDPRPPSTV